MTRTPPQPLPLGQAEIFPADVCPLEEVAAAAPADLAAALGFALDRLAVDDGRPLAFVALYAASSGGWNGWPWLAAAGLYLLGAPAFLWARRTAAAAR